jgi:hypothetical protein
MSVLFLLTVAPVVALLILAYDWLKERWARRHAWTGLES